MAIFLDQTYDQLVLGAPFEGTKAPEKVIRIGLSGTRMIVVRKRFGNRATIFEYNSLGYLKGMWEIVPGCAYRITPNWVRKMPLIEEDPDPLRRFCRLNGLPFTMIVRAKRGEPVYFGQAHHQGHSNFWSIEPDEPRVVVRTLWTTGNPSRVTKILVVKRREPKTWEDFVKIAQEWPDVKNGHYKLSA